MIAAWDVTKAMQETQIERMARTAARAAAIAGQQVDIARWAQSRTENWTDYAHKARALARAARAVSDEGIQDQAMQLLLSAFLAARLAGRTAMLSVLAAGANVIARNHGGDVLLRVYEEFHAVDQWLSVAFDQR